MKKKKKNYRHGDVLLKRISKEKVDLTDAKKMEHTVLAWGEVTGHKHEVQGEKEKMSLFEKNGVFYLVLEENSEITHEEHGTGTIKKGIYEVSIQRDWEPKGWKELKD